MTRLTNEMRDAICTRALTKAFKKQEEDHKDQEHRIGLELYAASFDKKVLGQAKRMPEKWIRQDACLRFNCAGYDLTFSLKKPVPVPYSTHCARLGNISGALAEKAQKHAQQWQDIRKKQQETRQALRAVLFGVSTLKQLKEAWPEGKEFYAMYDITSPQSKGGVPAVQIQTVNAMLGLKSNQKAA